MLTVFLAGGIGSGKSTVAAQLEELGACRIDLDQLSREVLAAGSPLNERIAEVFGADLLSQETRELDRRLLAQRAFATPEDAARLEALELPAIGALLRERLQGLAAADDAPRLCVVEVPLLDRMGEMLSLADEIVVVCCPLETRRVRAVKRGMTAEDFDARVANQPTDEWLRDHATCVIENAAGPEELEAQVRIWFDTHVGEGAHG